MIKQNVKEKLIVTNPKFSILCLINKHEWRIGKYFPDVEDKIISSISLTSHLQYRECRICGIAQYRLPFSGRIETIRYNER